MKKFLLEFGRDFLPVDEEYHAQVGNNDYYINLLFYQMCRKTPCFSYGDIRHIHRIYASN